MSIENATKLPFYALGKFDTSNISPKAFNKNMAVPDSSSDIIHRNKFSVNSSNFDQIKAESSKLHGISDLKNKDLNNYLNPLAQITHTEKYNIKPNQTNRACFEKQRAKYYIKYLF